VTQPGEHAERPPPGGASFATTHWSVVLAAADPTSPHAMQALERLCRAYWYPLYAYVRRRGYGPEEAEDLTQEFFLRILQSHGLSTARPEKGRFRSFLLGALKHFLSDARDRAGAKKRGGGRVIISWEQDLAEERFGREPLDEESPDRLFERRWALTILEQAAARLRSEYAAAGQAQAFEILKAHVTADTPGSSYSESAASLGLTETAVKSAIHRLRRRYRELVREEVAHTVADSEQLEEEIRHLMAVFSKSGAAFLPRPPNAG